MNCIAPAEGAPRQPCPHPREPGSLFCRGHELAPAAQRGGWLSAEKRRRRLAAHADQALDASSVTPQPAWKLWIGGNPPADRDLPEFDLIVLCAAEHPGPLGAFHGRVIRCPLRVGPLDNAQARDALTASDVVARVLRARKRVLVACHAGLNRAPLVAGLALARLTRMSAAEIIETMRSRRHPSALSNPSYQHLLATAQRYPKDPL